MIVLSFLVNKKKYQFKAEKGEDLLVSLDKFFKKNKINPTDIKRVILDVSQEKSITFKRIAQAIYKALKIIRG